jgi:hypothetical protein
MMTKTLAPTRSETATPVEPEAAKSECLSALWIVRGNQAQVSLEVGEDLEASATTIVERGFRADILEELAKLRRLPPFVQLLNLRTRIAESEQTLRDNEAKIATLRTGLGPNASDKEVSAAGKEIDGCAAKIRDSNLHRENARRFLAQTFTECERLARESMPALQELFSGRAAAFVARVADDFWKVARDCFVAMAVADKQSYLANSFLPGVLANVDQIVNPENFDAEMIRIGM